MPDMTFEDYWAVWNASTTSAAEARRAARDRKITRFAVMSEHEWAVCPKCPICLKLDK